MQSQASSDNCSKDGRCAGNRWLRHRLALLVLAAMSLASCIDSRSVDEIADKVVSPDTGFAMTVPATLSHRMLDKTALRLEYSVNDGGVHQAFSVGDGTGNYFVVVTGAPGSEVSVFFNWYIQLGDQVLNLAQYRTGLLQINSSSQTVNLAESEYVTDGEGLDDDRDAFSNLEEVKSGTNPFNSNSCPDCRTDVDLVVRKIGPRYISPVIDGAYDGIVWTENAQFKDQEDELYIDNLMVDNGYSGITSKYRWAGMHDGTYLYLMIFGRTGDKTDFSDSIGASDDESIEVFIGGDPLTNNTFYDGDDYHFIIPLASSRNSPNKSGLSSTRFEAGSNSALLPTVDFATCLCGARSDIWELRVPLAALGLVQGEVFGIDIQANLDQNGGPREAKFGWKHPARTTQDVNFTVVNPTYMGRAQLE